MLSCDATTRSAAASSSRELAGGGLRQPRELDRPVAGRGDRAQRSRQVDRRELANGVELERDLVGSHPVTISHGGVDGVAFPT